MSELDDLLKQASSLLPTKNISFDDDEDKFLTDISIANNIDPDILKAIDKAESGGRSDAVSPTGVVGRFQMTRGTAARYGVRDRSNFQDVAVGAAKLVKDLQNKYGDDPEKIFAAYNAGEGVVDEAIERASQNNTDWKQEVQNTNALNDVVLDIMKTKKSRGGDVVSFSNEKQKKIKEIEGHRNNILKFYNKDVQKKLNSKSLDELIEYSGNLLPQKEQTLDELINNSQELLNQPKEQEQPQAESSFVKGAYKSGLSSIYGLESSVASLPGMVLDAIALPTNLINKGINAATDKIFGKKFFKEDYKAPKEFYNLGEKLPTEALKQSFGSERLKKTQEELSQQNKLQEPGKGIGSSLYTKIKNGEIKDAAQYLAYASVETGAQNIVAALASIVTKDPRTGLAILSGSQGSSAMQDFVEKNPESDRTMATINSINQGLMEYAGEVAGTMKIMKPLRDMFWQTAKKEGVKVAEKKTRSYIVSLLKNLGVEAKSEVMTQLGQDLGDIVTGVNPKSLSQVISNVADAGLISITSSGPLATISTAVETRGEKTEETAKQPEQVTQETPQEDEVITAYKEADESGRQNLRQLYQSEPELIASFDATDNAEQQNAPTQPETGAESTTIQEGTQTTPETTESIVEPEKGQKEALESVVEHKITIPKKNWTQMSFSNIKDLMHDLGDKIVFEGMDESVVGKLIGEMREGTIPLIHGEVGEFDKTEVAPGIEVSTIKKPEVKKDDKENQVGVSSKVKEGQTPIKKEPVKEAGTKEAETGGVVQESPEEEVIEYKPTKEDSNYGKSLEKDVGGVKFNGVWGTTETPLLTFTSTKKGSEGTFTVPLNATIEDVASKRDAINATVGKTLERTKQSIGSEIGKKAARVKRLAENNPTIAKLIEGKSIEELAKFADDARIANKQQVETTETDTELQKNKENIYKQLESGVANYTPELENQLKKLSKNQFNKTFEIIEGKEGKIISVKDLNRFEELRGGEYFTKELNEETEYESIEDSEALKVPELKRQKESLTEEVKSDIKKQAQERYGIDPKDIIFTDLIRDKSGKVENLSGENGTPALVTNGKIHLSTKLTKESALSALSHEVVHKKGTPVLETIKENQKLHQSLRDLYDSDRDSDFTVGIESSYVEDINNIENNKELSDEEKQSSIDDLIFGEWLAERVRTIETKNIDKDGNYIKDGKKDNVLTRIIKAIRNFIADKLGLTNNDEKIDREVNKFINILKDKSIKSIKKEGKQYLKYPNKSHKKTKKYTKRERLETYIRDLAKIHYENTPIKIKDLKLRFFEFANKHLYSKIAGSSPDSYRKQLIIEINKIKEHGDEFHKNTIKMINEFSDWQDAKVAYDDVKRFTYQNRKKLKNTKNIKLEPVRDILNNIEKQYSRFEDYVTLKRLKDRVTIPRPKKKGSEELSKPRGQYQRLLDKKYIISITDTKGETNYKLTDAGKEYLSALKESLTDKDGRMFFVSDIQSKLADAKELYNSVREELKEIHTEKQEFVDSVVKETSEWLNKSRKDVGEKQGIGGFFKRVAKFIRYGSIDNFDFLAREMDDLNPDGPFQKMSKELNEGWINELKFKHDGEDLFNDKIKKLINKKELAEYSKAFHYGIFSPIAKKINVKPIYFKVGKENIPLTKAQRIALYMYSKNDRALKHILDGGIGLTRNSPKIYKPTVEEFNNFIETATDKEKKLAGIISEYFDWQASKINEVSQKDIGLNLADEENYLPLEVRSDEIKSIKDIKDIKSIDDIKNYFKAGLPSVLKTRTESIAPIVINDAFVSMAKSASMVEKYVGMAIPIKKISAILNNIKSMMLKKGLIEEFDTLKTAVRNLENPNAAGDSGFIYKLDQIYIPAKLGYNIPVTLMQPFSIILYLTQKTGKPPIKISDVIKNFKRPKSIMELAKKYSPLIRERYSGMAQQDLFEHNYYSRARSLSGTTHNKIRKFFSVEGAMFPLTYMDGLNTSMMWQFAESEVRTNTNLKDGTEEFYKKVAERTEELIRNTQGLFSKLDKPNWLNIPVLRPLSYFMSQPIKQAQITIEGITKMRKGFRENKPNMVVGGLSDVIVASLINTLIVESIRLGYNTVVGKAEPEEWSDIVGWIKKIMASMLSNFSFPGQMVGEAFSEFKRSFGGPWGELHDSIISLMRDGISITENGEIDWDKTLTHLNKLEKNVIIGDKTAQDVIMLIKKQLGEE